MKLYPAILISLLSALPVYATAQDAPQSVVATSEAPGQVAVAQGIEVQGKITKIDKKSRTVTLKGSEGNEVSFIAGPEVKRFDAAKVGDIVSITFYEAVALELKKSSAGIRERSEKSEIVRTKPGEKIGGMVSKQITVIADVVALDLKTKHVTLRGPKRTVELQVREPEMLQNVKVGDQVEARFIEATVITLTPGAKK